MSEIKRCPFCGGEAIVVNHHDDGYYCAVICSECILEMLSDEWSDVQSAEAEVTAKWNKRYEPRTPGGAYVPAGGERLKKGNG